LARAAAQFGMQGPEYRWRLADSCAQAITHMLVSADWARVHADPNDQLMVCWPPSCRSFSSPSVRRRSRNLSADHVARFRADRRGSAPRRPRMQLDYSVVAVIDRSRSRVS
jgi:hypothetical protein